MGLRDGIKGEAASGHMDIAKMISLNKWVAVCKIKMHFVLKTSLTTQDILIFLLRRELRGDDCSSLRLSLQNNINVVMVVSRWLWQGLTPTAQRTVPDTLYKGHVCSDTQL